MRNSSFSNVSVTGSRYVGRRIFHSLKVKFFRYFWEYFFGRAGKNVYFITDFMFKIEVLFHTLYFSF